jgi:MerR family copper efflux transcriptional regulator
MAARTQLHRNFQTYLTVKEAATFLGVSPSTLRNWDRARRLTAIRHPINGYRLYERGALAGVLAQICRSRRAWVGADPRAPFGASLVAPAEVGQGLADHRIRPARGQVDRWRVTE